MKYPMFSVVIPLYNRADVIADTLRSVLAQYWSDFEIVVIDDGSIDDPEPLVRAIDDNRIRFVRQDNAGGSAARNRGIDEARGRYIAFLDSDDRFLPDHLSTMVEAFRDASSECVLYSPVIVDRGDDLTFVKPPRAIRDDESMADYLMRDRGFVQTSGLVVPTLLARAVRYRPGLPFGQDTDFALRLAHAGGRFQMMLRPTVVWNDAFDPKRVSAMRKGHLVAGWLEQMRPVISRKAYLGYRGWHVAKGLAPRSPVRAARYYAAALFARCYSPKLSLVILLQILLPNRLYQQMVNASLSWRSPSRRRSQTPPRPY